MPTATPAATTIPATQVLGDELELIRARRRANDPQLAAARPRSREVFGLALSGGGIRSATVSLGVLQGLARAGLLHRFDYLSTVSGGGYIGAFFASLFRRPLDGNDKGNGLNAAATGHDAERILAEDFSRRPPGYSPTARPLGWQLQWLRKGSRYLAPSGAGDYLYAVALVLRNLVAIHYVLGLALVLAVLLAIGLDWVVQMAAFTMADLPGHASGFGLLLLSGALGAFWVAPSALAYFAAETPKSDDGKLPWWSTRTFWSFIAATAVAIGLSWWIGSFGDAGDLSPAPQAWRLGVARLLAGLAALMLLSVAMLLVVGTLARHRAGRGETSQARLLQGIRVDLTQVLAHGLSFLLAAVSAAALLLLVPHLREYTAKLVAAAVAAAPAARFLMSLVPQRKKDNEASPAWLQWLASAAGVLAFTLLVLGWTLAADALVSTWLMPTGISGFAVITSVLLLLALAFATGQSFQFLNLTTIQRMYASRIIRSYLGASNAERSNAGSRSAWQRISEAHPRDDLPRGEYYAADAWERGAPLHLINVTINQTVSDTDPLVQRDRKGRPLVVSPCALGVDGLWYDWDRPAVERGKPVRLEALTIGNWIGISGAAFSTGLGRATSLGKSMLFTIGNVRLGHWWKAWPEERAPRKRGPLDLLARGISRVFTTQAYLASELFARFSGTQLPYWYLTDGGHFENTGVYELLRRRVGMVLACDNGADPSYQLEDLANLMRLARIDMGCEFVRLVREDFGPMADAPRWLNAVIDDQRLTRGDGNEDKDTGRAMLFYAYRPLDPDGVDSGTALVVLKPRLAHSTPLDVLEYAATSPTFPQETTADQFFDEGQWESYRRLGAAQCEDLFAAAASTEAGQVDALTRLRDEIRAAARKKLAAAGNA
ncbi:patatin-like phospholipase family protein [Rhizobacter sp. OV335]|uniref:patatin-like phospholipase family protein n=1 Tax=Rhizobacter sp. OV335 TaxID=1500264 RepID=UPI0009241580|nr:patatin-like phospholipase family protein [Rhizobacter sp. OV335]SHM60536.1 Patatin-like phospholipase [Rhizobacter sp. OV335]